MTSSTSRIAPNRLAAVVAALALVATVAATVAGAHAQPKNKVAPGTVQGATLVATFAPAPGFVDDPYSFDGAGGRLVYVVSDAGKLCKLKLVDLTQGNAELATVDLSKVTTAPIAVDLVLGGESFLVTYHADADKETKAAVVINPKGKVVRRFGPATDLVYRNLDSGPVVVLFAHALKRDRKGRVVAKHVVEARSLRNGRRVGKKVSFDADETGYVKRHDFRILYWLDGYMSAVGIKGGEWDRKEDQRSPDQEAVFDVAQGIFSKRSPIANVVEHTKLAQLRAEHQNERGFMTVTRDLSRLQLVENGKLSDIALAQPFHHYDPKSLSYQPAPGGGWFVGLTIDPVNPEAVARKKADLKWLDIYRLAPGTKRAKRVMRILVGDRSLGWTASGEYVAVLYKHIGFSRGGKKLELYRFAK